MHTYCCLCTYMHGGAAACWYGSSAAAHMMVQWWTATQHSLLNDNVVLQHVTYLLTTLQAGKHTLLAAAAFFFLHGCWSADWVAHGAFMAAANCSQHQTSCNCKTQHIPKNLMCTNHLTGLQAIWIACTTIYAPPPPWAAAVGCIQSCTGAMHASLAG